MRERERESITETLFCIYVCEERKEKQYAVLEKPLLFSFYFVAVRVCECLF